MLRIARRSGILLSWNPTRAFEDVSACLGTTVAASTATVAIWRSFGDAGGAQQIRAAAAANSEERKPRRDPLATASPSVRRLMTARSDPSVASPEALLAQWRRVFLILEKGRQELSEKADRRLASALRRLQSATELAQAALIGTAGAGSPRQDSADREVFRCRSQVAKAEDRIRRQRRHVLSRLQRQLLQRRVLRYCRSVHLVEGMARTAVRVDSAAGGLPKLDASFINALNDMGFFETTRQRYMTAVLQATSASVSSAAAADMNTFRAAMARPVLNRRSREALATMLDDVLRAEGPLSGETSSKAAADAASNTSDAAVVPSDDEAHRQRLPRCMVTGQQAVALLLLVARLTLPIEAATQSALLSRALRDIASLPAKSIVSLAVWSSNAASPASSASSQGSTLSPRELRGLRDRVVEFVMHSPHPALHGADALHCLLALVRLEAHCERASKETLSQASAAAPPPQRRRVPGEHTPPEQGAGLQVASVRYAMLRRVVGGRLATPLQEQEVKERGRTEASIDKLLRQDAQRRHRIALAPGQSPKEKIRSHAASIRSDLKGVEDKKLVRIRSEYEAELKNCLSSVFAPVAPSALMEVVEFLVAGEQSLRRRGGPPRQRVPAEARTALRHVEAVVVALALQSLVRREVPVDWSRLLFVSAAVLTDLSANIDRHGYGLLTAAVAEAVDASLLQAIPFATSTAAALKRPLGSMTDPSYAKQCTIASTRALAAIGQLKELGFFDPKNALRCTSKAFTDTTPSTGTQPSIKLQQQKLRGLAGDLLRVLTWSSESNRLVRFAAVNEMTATGLQLQLATDGLRSLGMLSPTIATILGVTSSSTGHSAMNSDRHSHQRAVSSAYARAAKRTPQ